jgi:hypothetical protein
MTNKTRLCFICHVYLRLCFICHVYLRLCFICHVYLRLCFICHVYFRLCFICHVYLRLCFICHVYLRLCFIFQVYLRIYMVTTMSRSTSCCFTCRVLRNSCPQFLLWLVHVLCLHDRKLLLVLVELIDVTNLRLFILLRCRVLHWRNRSTCWYFDSIYK